MVLSRLKNSKVIGVVDEDAAEEPSRQDTVEALYPRVLLGAGEGEKGHARQFEGADLHILRWQSQENPLRSIHTVPP